MKTLEHSSSGAAAPPERIGLILNLVAGFILVALALAFEPRINGDAHEYLLMQEAIAGHGTLDIRPSDALRLAELYRDHPAAEVFIPEFIQSARDLGAGKDFYHGIYRSRSGKYYSFHFWFYALLSTPVKLGLRLCGADELKAFQVLNVLLMMLATTYLLVWCRLSVWMRLCLAVLAPFTGILYYLRWPSPEVFSATLLLLAGLLFLDRRYTWSIAAAVVASFQNPPIAFLVPLIFLCSAAEVYRKRRTWIALAGDAAAALFCLLPAAFFQLVFGTPNLIAKTGFTDTRLISLHRLHSFIFDLNQGLIVGMPAIVIATICLLAFRLTRPREAFRREDILLPGALLMMTGTTVAVNWSSGYAVFARYALWCGMPLVVWVACQLEQTRSRLARMAVMGSIVLAQIFTTLYFDGFGGFLSPYTHKPYVEWLLNVNPRLYNPEPEIFLERTLLREDVMYPRFMPVAYTGRDGAFRKILTERSVAGELVPRLYGPGGRLIDLNLRRAVDPSEVRYSWGNWGYLSGRFLCEANDRAASSIFGTQLGVAEPGGSLLSNGKAGVLQFGPYVSLPKGTYDIVWKVDLLKASQASGAPATVDITAENGNARIARRPVTLRELESHAIELRFTLPRPATRVEYRLAVSEGVILRLHGVERKIIR